MPKRRRYNVNIGVFPKLIGFPFGVGLLLVLGSLIAVMLCFFTFNFFPLILLIGVWIGCSYYNKKYGRGNFLFRKPSRHHDYIHTTQFITKITYNLKPNKDGYSKK